jgi:hypothetical protein
MLPAAFPFPVSNGRWLDFQTFERQDGKLYKTEIGAGLPPLSLPRASVRRWWKRPCRYLNGNTIGYVLARPRVVMDDPQVRVYLLADLEEAARNYKAAEHRLAGIPDHDDAMLTFAQLRKKCGVSKDFVEYWSNKRSRLRPGESALRAESRRVTGRAGVRSVQRQYRLGDARAILRGEESTHPAVGRPAIERPGAISDVQVCQFIKGALEEGGPLKKQAVRKLAGERKISWERLKRAASDLGVKYRQKGAGRNKVCYWCLPNQEPPELVGAPALRGVADFLAAALRNRPLPLQKLLALAANQGIATSQLFAARSAAGVISEREPHGWTRHSTWRLAATPLPTDASAPKQLPSPDAPSQAAIGKQGWRPREKVTAGMMADAYHFHQNTDMKLAAIRRKLEEKYGTHAPKEDSHVTLYAKRHATREGLSFVPRHRKKTL